MAQKRFQMPFVQYELGGYCENFECRCDQSSATPSDVYRHVRLPKVVEAVLSKFVQ